MKKPIGTTAISGETCPESGNWKIQGNPTTIIPVLEGNCMPSYEGRSVRWELLSYA